VHQPISHLTGGIPPLIRRNTLLLALSQAFVGAGTQLAYGIGPLMVVAVTGSAALAGLTVGLFGVSRFLVSYPTGRITDTYGRKPGIVFGQGLALAGTIVSGLGMLWHSVSGVCLGMVIFTMGISASQQLRVAAADMYPPRMRGMALGFLATGSLVGIALSPGVMAMSESISRRTNLDPLGLPWLMMPTLILVGMALVSMVQPDPKVIGQTLEHYYPAYRRPDRIHGVKPTFSGWDLWRNKAARLAIISNCAGQGNMSIVMVLTSLVLSHHGHSLTAIAISHMFHSTGMFAFMIPLGWAADRLGREWVMYPGVAVTLVGALFVTVMDDSYAAVTLGTFLVGLGWSAANVASTALIADCADTEHRGRAIGVSETGAGAMTLVAAAVTGPLVECTSLPAAGFAAVLVAVVPLALLAWTKAAQLRAVTS
jgi:MFS family permease